MAQFLIQHLSSTELKLIADGAFTRINEISNYLRENTNGSEEVKPLVNAIRHATVEELKALAELIEYVISNRNASYELVRRREEVEY